MAEYDEDNMWGGEEFGEVSRNNKLPSLPEQTYTSRAVENFIENKQITIKLKMCFFI